MAKGIGIVAVVGLHLTNRSARYFHAPFDSGWWTLTWINRFLNFCVPLFLLISAVLLARSAAAQEKPDWGRFAWRRLRSILIPLVIWSVFYWLLRAYIQHDPKLVSRGYWLEWKPRLTELLLGKAEFHLYFLSILAQFCLVLPFLVILFKRVRINLWVALLIAILMQYLAFWVQKIVLFQYPGSIVFWYLSTLIPGVWVGMNWKSWPDVRRQTWVVWIFFAVAGFAVFGYESYLDLTKAHPNGTVMNAAGSAYALGMPVLILALITLWGPAAAKLKQGFVTLGVLSMQIYLMHPILLELLSKPKIVAAFKLLPLSSLWFFLATLLGTLAIALVLNKIPYVNTIFFGREAPKKKADPVVAPLDAGAETSTQSA